MVDNHEVVMAVVHRRKLGSHGEVMHFRDLDRVGDGAYNRLTTIESTLWKKNLHS